MDNQSSSEIYESKKWNIQFCKATDPHEKTVIKKRFKLYRNYVVTLSRIFKENYYKEYSEDNRKNAKKLRSEIRSIINIKNKKFQNISLTIDSKTAANSTSLADRFNKFFTSIADKLLQKVPKTDKRFSDFQNLYNENYFFISRTDPEKVQDLINLMELHKAVGPSSILTRILKDFKKPLSHFINVSFNNGVFP